MFVKVLKYSFLIFALCFISCNKAQDSTNVMPDVCGVWANENCELIRTNKYRVLILKKETHFIVTVKELIYKDEELFVDTKMSARFKPEGKTMEAIGTSLRTAANLLINNSSALLLESKTYKASINKHSEPNKKEYKDKEGRFFEQLVGKNKIQTYSEEGDLIELERIHDILPIKAYAMTDAKRTNIGICIQEWLSGVRIEETGSYNSLLINIRNYNCRVGYGRFNGNDIVYVRTANFSTNNKGMVFKQNIRLMHNELEHTAWINPNHFKELCENPEVTIENFSNPQILKTNTDNYWQLIDFDAQQIKLKNNSQRLYVINKPMVDEKEQCEWFDFQVVYKDNMFVSATTPR